MFRPRRPRRRTLPKRGPSHRRNKGVPPYWGVHSEQGAHELVLPCYLQMQGRLYSMAAVTTSRNGDVTSKYLANLEEDRDVTVHVHTYRKKPGAFAPGVKGLTKN